MQIACQLDLFEESNELNELRHKVNAIEESTGKVRRGIYAKHSELAKKYMELHYRLEIIERNICTNGT